MRTSVAEQIKEDIAETEQAIEKHKPLVKRHEENAATLGAAIKDDEAKLEKLRARLKEVEQQEAKAANVKNTTAPDKSD